ncbi:MAG TPA: DNA-3-methyladenine glycosylase [Actinomycetota bacterium]
MPKAFYGRSACEVAPDLLGRTLVRRMPDGQRLAGRIVETEAYEPGDPASHGFRGITARNAAMFGPAGHLYVYFTYGNHWMLNAVTAEPSVGSAVLLRALEPLEGLPVMAAARGRERSLDLCSGPGKLAQAMLVDGAFDGADLVRGSAIWIETGTPVPRDLVGTSVRVGVRVGLNRAWRYFVTDDPFVSRGRPGPPGSRPRGSPTASAHPRRS